MKQRAMKQRAMKQPRRCVPVRSRLAALWTSLALVATLLLTVGPPASAAGSGCNPGPENVFTDSLQPPWYPASWAGTTVDASSGANELTFPKRWSAFSVMTNDAIDVSGCDSVTFTISTTAPNPKLLLRLNDGDRTAAGSHIINNPDYVSDGTIGSQAKTVTVPLGDFTLNGEVSRFTIINNSGTAGISVTVDDINFTNGIIPPPPQGDCEIVYDDALRGTWQPASWTVAGVSYSAGNAPEGSAQIAATFPQRWGALSHLSQPAVDISGCEAVTFQIKASTSDAAVDVRLNNQGGEPAGPDQRINVGTSYQTVTIDLSAWGLLNGQVSRLSILNRSASTGVTIFVDALKFTGGAGGGGGGGGGGGFDDVTLPPGSALPTGAECAANVTATAETVPENTPWNQRVGRSVAGETYIYDQAWVDPAVVGIEARVDGNFTGTTDELIQWAACKWGFESDLVRAQVYTESSWFAGKLGDCNEETQPRTGGSGGCASTGLLQVRSAGLPNPVHPGTWPMAWDSSAFGLDYALAVERLCFEGFEVWLATTGPYQAGDLLGCMGRWFSGQWRDGQALNYINVVNQNLNARAWENAAGRGCPTWEQAFYCSGIDRNADGSRR